VSDIDQIEKIIQNTVQKAVQGLATKADLQNFVTKSDLAQTEKRLNGRIDKLDGRMDQMVTKKLFMEQIDRLDNRIDAVEARLAKEVNRLDQRLERTVDDAEDRMAGKMAEIESRIMHRMGRRFDEMAVMIGQSHKQLSDAIAGAANRPY